MLSGCLDLDDWVRPWSRGILPLSMLARLLFTNLRGGRGWRSCRFRGRKPALIQEVQGLSGPRGGTRRNAVVQSAKHPIARGHMLPAQHDGVENENARPKSREQGDFPDERPIKNPIGPSFFSRRHEKVARLDDGSTTPLFGTDRPAICTPTTADSGFRSPTITGAIREISQIKRLQHV
jgi:hypothetical protein